MDDLKVHELPPSVRVIATYPDGTHPETLEAIWDSGAGVPAFDQIVELVKTLQPARRVNPLVELLRSGIPVGVETLTPCPDPECAECAPHREPEARSSDEAGAPTADVADASLADDAATTPDVDNAEKPADSEPVPAPSWGGFTG